MNQLSKDEIQRYSRHLSLPEFGVAAQNKLKAARILVIGAGGLGCPALQYLAAAGVGTLGIVDDDVIDVSNLQRQILYGTSDIGRLKVEIAAQRLAELNSLICIEAHAVHLSVENACDLISTYDFVIDGSDNFATRYIVNDACVECDKAFAGASIFKFEGQLSVYNGTDSVGKRGPTYRCLYPEPPDPASVPPCGQVGVLGFLPGVLGTLQATEAVKYITGVGEVLSGRLLVVDILKGSFNKVSFPRSEEVVKRTRLLTAEQYLELCGGKAARGENMNAETTKIKELTVKELKERMENGEDCVLIDVREPFEREIANIGGALIPLGDLKARLVDIPRTGQVVIYCRSGGRSAEAVSYLQREHGYENLENLTGGVLAWATEIDSSMPTY